MEFIKGSKELLLLAEKTANDKGISVESIVIAIENGLTMAAKKKYGHDLNVECIINRKSGEIKLYNLLEVVTNETEEEINYKKQIKLADAVEKISNEKAMFQETVNVGENIKVELPPIDLNNLIAQVAKNEILRKIKEAEKEKEYSSFVGKIGSIIYGIIKKVGQKSLVIEVDGYETLLHKENLIPGEYFRVGDRIKAYVSDVIKGNDNQIFLSRTDGRFLIELLKQEVPEMYDGLIEAKAVVRDPGSKAKLVVYSRDNISDVVGLCVGARGCKIQAVSSELKGEKIDVIKWSDEEAILIANLLSPAKVNKVIINDKTHSIDVVMPNDQLNLAIGRGGQNIRLACRIIGNKINILTEEEEKKKREKEFNELTDIFVDALDVEEMIAQLLIAEGYASIEELSEASIEELQKIEGFDEDIAGEIKLRAEEFLQDQDSDDNEVSSEEFLIKEE